MSRKRLRASSAPSRPQGAAVYNCSGEIADVEDVASAIRAVRKDASINVAGPPVGVPADVESRAIYAELPSIERVGLLEGIRRTIAFYEQAGLEGASMKTGPRSQ